MQGSDDPPGRRLVITDPARKAIERLCRDQGRQAVVLSWPGGATYLPIACYQPSEYAVIVGHIARCPIYADVRRALAAHTVLARVSKLAKSADVEIDTDLLSGDIGPAILDAARDWPADLVIVGKSARSASGEPYVGAQTRHVLEFASQPVLVVAAE